MSKFSSLVSILLFLTAATLVYTLPRSGFDTRLDALLPEKKQSTAKQLAQKHLRKQAVTRLLLFFGHPNKDIALRSAVAAKQSLQKTLPLAQAQLGPPRGNSKLLDFYQTHRASLIPPARFSMLQNSSPEKIADQAFRALLSPGASVRILSFEQDPFGTYTQWLMNLSAGQSLPIEGDFFLARDKKNVWAILAIRLPPDSSILNTHSAVIPALEIAIRQAKNVGAQKVMRSGFIFHAQKAQSQAKFETTLIGGLSILAISLLAWLLFGSLRPLILIFIPVLSGVLVALAASFWVFGQPHIFSLVFGATVIGIGVDYGMHFLSGSLLAGKTWHAAAQAKKIRPDLLLALATSTGAYAAVALMPIPVLRQMAFMAVVGLTTACWAALVWLPPLFKAPPKKKDTPFTHRMNHARPGLTSFLSSSSVRAAWLGLGLLCLIALFYRPLTDAPSHLYSPDQDLIKQQRKVSSLVFGAGSGDYLISRGSNLQKALQSEEHWREELDKLITRGELNGYQALSRWLPSVVRQKKNSALSAKLFSPGQALDKLTQRLGAPQAAKKIRALNHAPESQINLAALIQNFGSSADLLDMLQLKKIKGAAILMPLKNLSPQGRASLRTFSKSYPQSLLFSPQRELKETLEHSRKQASLLLLAAILAAGLIISIKWRRASWRILVPPLLSSVIALGLPALWGQPLSLFGVLGILLVLGMGLDYGIYLAAEEADSPNAFFTIFAAASSTLFAFGVLMFSTTPALSGFGTSVGLGVGACALISISFSKGKPDETN